MVSILPADAALMLRLIALRLERIDEIRHDIAERSLDWDPSDEAPLIEEGGRLQAAHRRVYRALEAFGVADADT